MSNPNRPTHVFAKVDQDRGGIISLDECKAAGRLEQGFRRVNSDGDGKDQRGRIGSGDRPFPEQAHTATARRLRSRALISIARDLALIIRQLSDYALAPGRLKHILHLKQ